MRLHLLGPPRLLDDAGAPVPGLGPGKPLAVLAYIILRGEVRRDELVALLWGESEERKARNAFRQALHRLRAAIGASALPEDPERIGLASGFEIWCDAREFESLLDANQIDAALALYGGEFLEGFESGETAFSHWADAERSRLRARFAWGVEQVARAALQRGDWAEGVKQARRLREADVFSTDAAVLEATALIAAGRRAEAAAGLRQFAANLDQELGLPVPGPVREMLARLGEEAPKPRTIADAPAEMERIDNTPPPFVGRERELTRLISLWGEVQGGHSAAVLIDGDTGIGKSRLLDEFAVRARSLGSALILTGRERAGGAPVPYASIAEALRQALRAPGLAGASTHLLAEASRIVPELRDRFKLPDPVPIGDGADRLRFFEGVAALLDAVCYEQPVCLILEDLQHASPNTLDLLAYLIIRLRGSAVFFLLSMHESGTPARERLEAVLGRDGLAGGAITLEPLSERESVELLGALTTSFADERERIARISGGNPLRLTELVQRVLAGERISAAPVRLQDVLASRVQRCTPAQRRLLIACALIERNVPLRVVAAAAHLSEPAAFDAAVVLEQLGLLVQREGGIQPAHDAAVTIALDNAGPAGRALLAGWAAEALVAHRRGTHAELAHLNAIAGREHEAYEHARAAAHEALIAGALPEMVRLLNIALTFAPGERERTEVEHLLGGGRPRLTGSTSSVEGQQELFDDRHADEVFVSSRQPGDTSSAGATRLLTRRRAGVTLVAALLLAIVTAGLLGRTGGGAGALQLSDTLVVSQPNAAREGAAYIAELGADPRIAPLRASEPAWADSVHVPWINARVSPTRDRVAVERMTSSGTDVFVISADRRDTTALAVGAGDDVIAGWSPDGRWLLAMRAQVLPDGSYDSDLLAYPMGDVQHPVAIDTTASRAVVEAAWSPTGTQIGWTARAGAQRQQDVFMSSADGSSVRNMSSSSSEDYHIAWSPDGRRIAFTSERTGRAEIHSVEIATGRITQLTSDNAHSDRAQFSPNGRYLAYESTRGGTSGVYVISAWGGEPRRATTEPRYAKLEGWLGRQPGYLDRITLRLPRTLQPRDTARVVVAGSDQYGTPIDLGAATWSMIDDDVARFVENASSEIRPGHPEGLVVALKPGLARLAVRIGGWRADTGVVKVGNAATNLIATGFDEPLEQGWIPVGEPSPRVAAGAGIDGSNGLLPNGDRQWESGVLSDRTLPLRYGLDAQVWVNAQQLARPVAATGFTMALVAAETQNTLDPIAPQFLRLASISWLGEAGRIAYAVEREIWTEPASALGPGDQHLLRIALDREGRATFYVDGRPRWTSTSRVSGEFMSSGAALWLGSQSTGEPVAFDNVKVVIGGS